MAIRVIGLDLAKSVFQAHGVDESGVTVLVKKLHSRGDLRGRAVSLDALLADKDGRAAGDPHSPTDAVASRTPAHHGGERAPGPSRRVRAGRQSRHRQPGEAVREGPCRTRRAPGPGPGDPRPAACGTDRRDRHARPRTLRRHAQNEASQRLAAIPGIGVITATAIAATATDPEQLDCLCHFVRPAAGSQTTGAGRLVLRVAHHGGGADDQQAAKVPVPLLGDAAEACLAAGGLLLRC